MIELIIIGGIGSYMIYSEIAFIHYMAFSFSQLQYIGLLLMGLVFYFSLMISMQRMMKIVNMGFDLYEILFEGRIITFDDLSDKTDKVNK